MSTDHFSLTLPNGDTIQVRWVRSARARHLRLSLAQSGPRVTTPPRAHRMLVERFVESQKAWLAAHLTKRQELADNHMLFLGKDLHLKFDHAGSGERVQLVDNTLTLRPVQMTVNSAEKLLDRWLQTQASEVCAPLLRELAEKMGVSVTTLKFRHMSSRWGSCSAHGAIMLNWRLIHAPRAVIRYVVVHELAHRIQLNHSLAFWKVVMEFDPDFRVHRGWLKRHGHLCVHPTMVLEADR